MWRGAGTGSRVRGPWLVLAFGGDLDEQRGAAADGARDVEGAPDCLEAVAEPGQSGPPGGVGSADPVVADRQLQDRVGCVEFDMHGGGTRVLSYVSHRSEHRVERPAL